MQYVKNDAQTVYLEAQIKEGANVTFEKDGTTYAAGQDIPIAEGANWITMTIEQGGRFKDVSSECAPVRERIHLLQ